MGEPAKRGITEIIPPNSDQIEIRLFGPGYGECAAVHLGENRWIVVDSCLNNKTGNPAVLDYFNSIGVQSNKAVKLIIISHWHDDHVRGLSSVISACKSASVCCSSVLTKKEFLAYVLAHQKIYLRTKSYGVSEINQILRGVRTIKKAIANRIVLNLPAEGEADPCIAMTLSPSDKEYDNFLQQIMRLIPLNKQAKKRAPALTPNDTAVALWIEVGNIKILLGSDLEEKNDPESGWSAIVQSTDRPHGRASIFKVPHHGSSTGHHDDIWTDMMNSPISVLSPFYNAGKKLPTNKDVARIKRLSNESYITSKDPIPNSRIRRDLAVERTIRQTVAGKNIRKVQPAMGWVSLRNGGKLNPNLWTVDLSVNASALNDFTTIGV